MKNFESLSTEALLLLRDKFYDDIFNLICERFYGLGFSIIHSFFKCKYGYVKGFDDDIKDIYMYCIKTAYEKYQINSGLDFSKYFSRIVRFKCTADITRRQKTIVFDSFPIEGEGEKSFLFASSDDTPVDEYQKNELIDRIQKLKDSDLKIGKFSFAEAFDITVNYTVKDFLQKFPKSNLKSYYYLTSRVKNYIKVNLKK